MTTTFLLVRHAAHDWLWRGLAGRLPGVTLNAEGRAQARALADRLAGLPIGAIYSSPQLRTRETAQPLASRLDLAVGVDPGFDEIDFGDWMGRTFDELRAEGEAWQHWVDRRGTAQPPGGEPFAEVPRRALAGLQGLREAHPGQHVVVVSHGDVIKATLATGLGLSLDHLDRFEIAPASVSVVVMGEGWMQVKLVNGGVDGIGG